MFYTQRMHSRCIINVRFRCCMNLVQWTRDTQYWTRFMVIWYAPLIFSAVFLLSLSFGAVLRERVLNTANEWLWSEVTWIVVKPAGSARINYLNFNFNILCIFSSFFFRKSSLANSTKDLPVIPLEFTVKHLLFLVIYK